MKDIVTLNTVMTFENDIYIWKQLKQNSLILNNNKYISQYCCFYFIFAQINTVLVKRWDFFENV